MARDRLEKDTDYVCCEQCTGRAIQGALRLSDDRIEVRLVSFDDFFFIDRDTEHLPLRLFWWAGKLLFENREDP